MEAVPHVIFTAAQRQKLMKNGLWNGDRIFTKNVLLRIGEIVFQLQLRVAQLMKLFSKMQAKLSETAVRIFQFFHFNQDLFHVIEHYH